MSGERGEGGGDSLAGYKPWLDAILRGNRLGLTVFEAHIIRNESGEERGRRNGMEHCAIPLGKITTPQVQLPSTVLILQSVALLIEVLSSPDAITLHNRVVVPRVKG